MEGRDKAFTFWGAGKQKRWGPGRRDWCPWTLRSSGGPRGSCCWCRLCKRCWAWRPSLLLSSASGLWSPGPSEGSDLKTETHVRCGDSTIRGGVTVIRALSTFREPCAISSCLLASPSAEKRSSLILVSALRLFSRCWVLSCMADRADISTSVSFSFSLYLWSSWKTKHTVLRLISRAHCFGILVIKCLK